MSHTPPPTIVHMISSPVRGAPREIMYQLVSDIVSNGAQDTGPTKPHTRHPQKNPYQAAVIFLREGHAEAQSFNLDSMKPQFEALGIPMIVTSMERVWNVSGARALRHFLQDNNAALICSHLNRADLWATYLGRQNKIPTVRAVHGLEAWRTVTFPSPRYAIRLLDRLLLRRSSKIVCVSEESRRLLIEYQKVPETKAVHIPGGIDIERFSVARPPFSRDTAPVLGMITRLTGEKGIREYISAVGTLQRERPDCPPQALIAGAGPEEHALREHATATGATIDFLGHVHDVPALLAKIDVFVLPSYHEGTPLSVAEAMSAGRVVVTSDVGGLPHMISDHHNGRLVPARDTTTLTNVLREILEDPVKARAYATQAGIDAAAYSRKRMTTAWKQLYDELL